MTRPRDQLRTVSSSGGAIVVTAAGAKVAGPFQSEEATEAFLLRFDQAVGQLAADVSDPKPQVIGRPRSHQLGGPA